MIPLPYLPMLSLVEVTGAARDRALARAPQAEWGLAHQGASVLLTRDQGAGWLVRRAGGRLVAIGRPLGPPALPELARSAAGQGLAPLLYKCDGRTAAEARAAGWAVLRLGHEALLDLRDWGPDRPACRQLRRKLRAAAQAGVEVAAPAHLPLAEMEEVALDWLRRTGRERGFSMGRFDAALLARQRVVVGRSGGRLVAFASFHASAGEWTLDLMRHREGAPDGTMHRLVAEAAALACAAGARRLSLAAIPEPAAGRALMEMLGLGACGLAQFKRSFGPRLVARYAAAPGRLSLAQGLAAVAWAVRHPEPLPGAAPPVRLAWTPSPARRPPHFGFEPVGVPCDARPAQQRTARPSPLAAPLRSGDP